MSNKTLGKFFVIVILITVLSACGTAPSAAEPDSASQPQPTPYDTQASADDQQRLEFFRQDGTWSFIVNSQDESEWLVVILGKESALTGKELQLGSASAPNLDSVDVMFLVVKLISAEQEEARNTFFRLYADGIDQGAFDAFLLKTAPLSTDAKVSVSGATALTKDEFLDLVLSK